MSCIVRSLIGFALLTLLLLARPCLAEPMPPFNWADLCNSQSVVEARYVTFRKPGLFKPITYFDPPVAKYKVLRTIHGQKTPPEIEVAYDVQDGSACLEPPDWKCTDDIMPRTNSEWVLFLSSEVKGIYRTYRGDFGRIPAGSLARYLWGECGRFWYPSNEPTANSIAK